MIRVIFCLFLLCLPLLADDPKPTVEQLQAQIQQLQRQLADAQQAAQSATDAYQGCTVSRAQMAAQQRQQQPKPEPKQK